MLHYIYMSNLGISSYDHAKTSLNSFSSVTNASFSEEVKVLPIWTILGSSSVPRLADWVSSFIGSTCPCFSSPLLKVSLLISKIKKIQSQQVSRIRNYIIGGRVFNRLNRNLLYRNRNMIINRFNRNSNTSRDRLNGNRKNIFSIGKWLGDLGLLQWVFHGVGNSFPCLILQLSYGFKDGSILGSSSI